ncbi:hypothetical protein G5I_01724 [Acromyrmex echinatior]|uniref:Uncharacterized protein n=1 Tax=Acromyrmex echinatior TaxID=103372 RepID=F4W8E3_ACREC|nr:hypothetical protein G5I_01724 [Acromyrmex echinatior]
MKKRDKRRPAEGEPGRTGEIEGGDGKRVGTRFGLPDTVGKDLNVDRSSLSSSARTFRSVWRLVSPSLDGGGDGDDDDNRDDESRLCMKPHLFIKSPTTSSSRRDTMPYNYAKRAERPTIFLAQSRENEALIHQFRRTKAK